MEFIFPRKEDYEILDTFIVEEAMVTDVKTIEADCLIETALETVKDSSISGYPVLKAKEFDWNNILKRN